MSAIVSTGLRGIAQYPNAETKIRKLAYWSNQRKNLNSEWYFLLAPLAVLAVLSLFRFVGCQIVLR
jgi:hypothetical protein